MHNNAIFIYVYQPCIASIFSDPKRIAGRWSDGSFIADPFLMRISAWIAFCIDFAVYLHGA
ncbi:hypothetical protein LBWT_X2990 (plasmid) [Leptolyngbya boryana IAM M-101]|jgi:hypothetical protein|nr:hypothetical protein LBWT_X2990 [Leptolyngbya boryana IAM M-101]BAS66575.1 hypothetical protein LBDG_X2990 [Leptolyngbya boryana dg5]